MHTEAKGLLDGMIYSNITHTLDIKLTDERLIGGHRFIFECILDEGDYLTNSLERISRKSSYPINVFEDINAENNDVESIDKDRLAKIKA